MVEIGNHRFLIVGKGEIVEMSINLLFIDQEWIERERKDKLVALK